MTHNVRCLLYYCSSHSGVNQGAFQIMVESSTDPAISTGEETMEVLDDGAYAQEKPAAPQLISFWDRRSRKLRLNRQMRSF